MTKWNNPLPNWLNILFVLIILVLLVAGAIPFMMGDTAFRYESFIASGAAFVLWVAVQLALAVFTQGDLSTILAVALIVVGVAMAILAVIKPALNYAAEAASALIGAGCGLPIGEQLRRNQAKPQAD